MHPRYRELIVWQRAFELALEVLELGESAPFSRRFYFRDQMCDAAMSIPANIAEGNGRSTPLDYASFIDRARGSTLELDTWLLAAARRGYLDASLHERLEATIDEVSRMLYSLARQLRTKPALDSRG
jgi:four helix bundle protein